MTTSTRNAAPPPSREDVEAKRFALETVHAEREDLEKQLPRLTAEVAAARDRLEKAHEDELVASRTAGLDDDVAAAASVKEAQAALDAACEKRADVEQRIERWTRAEERLTREFGALQGAFTEAQRHRAMATLRARLDEGRTAFEGVVRDVAALRFLDGQSTWPQELERAIDFALGTTTQQLIREGQELAARARGGEEI
jgi:chromosome segregation ATPase